MSRSERPTLLFVGAHPRSGGSNIAASRELANQLAGDGWPVTVVSSRASGMGRLLEQLYAPLTCDGQRTLVLLDVFGGRAFNWARAVGRVCEARAVPYITILHGGGLPEVAASQPRHVQRLLTRAAAVVTPSPWLARTVASQWVRPLVIPNGVDLSAYAWRPRTVLSPRLLWMRALHPIYRPELAVAVIRRLHDDGVAATLHMVGPDKANMRVALEQSIASVGLADSITVVGPVAKTDVPGWMHKADILLNTTDVDNAPVSLVEALACGLAIVTTDAGGIPDLLRDYAGPPPVTRGSVEALVDAIHALLAQPTLATAAAESSRTIVEGYDWPVVRARWNALLHDVMRGRV